MLYQRPLMQPSDQRLSRFLALVLRHRPDTVGVVLDPSGFVEVAALAHAVAATSGWAGVTADSITLLARRDRRRYELAEGKIRARYGHSVAIETRPRKKDASTNRGTAVRTACSGSTRTGLLQIARR